MINSIGSYGSSMSMWNVSRSMGAQSTSSTEETRKSPGEEMFSKLDSDSSGGLSSSELQSFVDTMSNATRGALLSTQEESGTSSTTTSSTSTTTADDLLTAMDTDGDGSVSQSELDTYMKDNAPAGGPPPPPPPPEESASTEGTDPSTAMYSAIDADGDGAVSQTELSDFLAAMSSDTSTSSTDDTTSTTSTDDTSTTATSTSSDVASLFSTIDSDSDGSVSQSELDTYLRAQAPPPPPRHHMMAEATSTDATSSASSTTTSDDTTTTTSSTTTSTTSTTTDDLTQQLLAAMAQFATQAYGRMQTGNDLAGLLGAVV